MTEEAFNAVVGTIRSPTRQMLRDFLRKNPGSKAAVIDDAIGLQVMESMLDELAAVHRVLRSGDGSWRMGTGTFDSVRDPMLVPVSRYVSAPTTPDALSTRDVYLGVRHRAASPLSSSRGDSSWMLDVLDRHRAEGQVWKDDAGGWFCSTVVSMQAERDRLVQYLWNVRGQVVGLSDVVQDLGVTGPWGFEMMLILVREGVIRVTDEGWYKWVVRVDAKDIGREV